MKLGAKIAGSGEAIYNPWTTFWYILVSNYVKSAFINQDKTIAEIAKTEDVDVLDLHVRVWSGRIRLSNGLFLFGKSLNEAIRDAENNKGSKTILYRIVYDDLLPKSVWRWKLLKRTEVELDKVIAKIKKLFTDNEISGNLISVTLQSAPELGYFNLPYNIVQAPRVFHSDEKDAFLAWLGTTPQDSGAIVDATPNDVFHYKEGIIMPDPKLWRQEIAEWLTVNRLESKATYLLNFV
jgi:hypothetical protein